MPPSLMKLAVKNSAWVVHRHPVTLSSLQKLTIEMVERTGRSKAQQVLLKEM